MIRKIIFSLVLIGLTSSAFAQEVNYLQVTNNSNTNGLVIVSYNEFVKQKLIAEDVVDVAQHDSVATNPKLFPVPPAYQITSIFYKIDSGSTTPITSCPVLNFSQIYAGILLTINPDGSCNAVVTPFGG